MSKSLKNHPSPRISIVLPAYNNQDFLRPAIESIINQTYTNWELILIDDASTDSSPAIMREYQKQHPNKIKVVQLRKNRNKGGDDAGNIAFQHSNPASEFIARMDADDIAKPNRLEAQLAYMQAHPEVSVMGSSVEIIDKHDKVVGSKEVPTHHEQIAEMFFRVHPMIHPTIMIRRSQMLDPKNMYRQDLSLNNDYLTFAEMISKGKKFANSAEPLLQYRIHSTNASVSNLKKTFYNTLTIRQKMVLEFGYRPSLISWLVLFAQLGVLYFIPQPVLRFIYLVARGMVSPSKMISSLLKLQPQLPVLPAKKLPKRAKLVFVIPTYNEKGNIKPLIYALTAVSKQLAKKYQLHLLFVDDNSPDGTATEITKVASSKKVLSSPLAGKVHTLNNANKQGLGKAYLVGIDHAVYAMKANLIGQFDADLSHDPYKISALIEKIEAGYDFVVGSRYVAGGSIPADWGWYRKTLSNVGNLIVRFGIGHPEINDWSSGFRIFRSEVYTKIEDKLNEEQFFGYLIMIGLLHQSIRTGFTVAEVPFHFVDRTYGESKLGIDYIFSTLGYVAVSRLKSIRQKFISDTAVAKA